MIRSLIGDPNRPDVELEGEQFIEAHDRVVDRLGYSPRTKQITGRPGRPVARKR